MAYNTYMPQPGWVQSPQTANNMIFVTGTGGANALPMGPNSRVVAFDEDKDVMYFITTDGGGYKTVKEFDFLPRLQHDAQDNAGLATREDIDNLRTSMGDLADAVSRAIGDLASRVDEARTGTEGDGHDQ